MTIQTAVLIESLQEVSALMSAGLLLQYFLHAGPCRRRHRRERHPGFRLQGREPQQIWEFVDRILEWPGGQPANVVLDDGGDATLIVQLGAEAEKNPSVLRNPQSEEEESLFKTIKARLERTPGWYSKVKAAIKGVSEETTTGVLRLYQMEKKRACCPSPASTSTTA